MDDRVELFGVNTSLVIPTALSVQIAELVATGLIALSLSRRRPAR